MRIVFSGHAKQQMQERNLTEIPIRLVIQQPQTLHRQSKDRFRAVGYLPGSRKGYVLIVVYDVISGNRMEVVTAFVSSKINKYL
jgi:uncharacterized DUF497 family protein